MLKKLSVIIIAMIITNTSIAFGADGANPKAEEAEKNMMSALKDNAKRGVISIQEYAAAINQIHSIKETHQHILNEESATKYKNIPTKTPLPIISWELVGINQGGDIFERIEKMYTPEGWIVKVITINKSLYHGSETTKYMYVPDAGHKWKVPT